MTKYKRIDVRTLKGIKEAERLKSKGWKIVLNSFSDTNMLFERLEK